MENNYIEEIVETLSNSQFKEMCGMVLDDAKFHHAPGSSGHHHAFVGGLYQHTAEVMQTARNMSIDDDMRELLTVAALFHDRNKIFEYSFNEDGSIERLSYRKLIGHVSGSWQYFVECSDAVCLDSTTQLAIGHCLLSHHGRLEWRSPVEPQTPEAFILHSADMLSMLRGSK